MISRAMRAVIVLLFLSAGFAVARAAVVFQDDFSNAAFSDANWTYIDDSPDYSGGSAAFGSTASQMVIELNPSLFGANLPAWSTGYSLAAGGVATISVGSSANGVAVDPDGYIFTLDYDADTFTVERQSGGGTSTLLSVTDAGFFRHHLLCRRRPGSHLRQRHGPRGARTSLGHLARTGRAGLPGTPPHEGHLKGFHPPCASPSSSCC